MDKVDQQANILKQRLIVAGRKVRERILRDMRGISSYNSFFGSSDVGDNVGDIFEMLVTNISDLSSTSFVLNSWCPTPVTNIDVAVFSCSLIELKHRNKVKHAFSPAKNVRQ